MGEHNGQEFSTFDADNENHHTHCAQMYKGMISVCVCAFVCRVTGVSGVRGVSGVSGVRDCTNGSIELKAKLPLVGLLNTKKTVSKTVSPQPNIKVIKSV